MSAPVIAAVVIGRNEGERLIRCLRSLQAQVQQLIYVDSGSTDGSAAAARDLGAEVVDLDLSRPFTAARARNAGLAALSSGIELVQFADGDCELAPGWIGAAADFMQTHPRAAAVCGRRRERFPEASVYNRLCDAEWNTPVGEATACGGDAMMRVAAVYTAGGYRESLIAGEEPELCLRLRRAGWQVWRLDAEMTLHDAQMLRFGQWWNRSRRAGHAFAEGAALHGAGPERHWVAETRRTLAWGAVLPAAIAAAGLISPYLLLASLIYPAQILRLSRRMGTEQALFSVLGKFAEASGALEFYWRRWRGTARGILEYK
ncbi:glycosyltransferase [Leisingera caerulea]|uniref:glycosyltransferase n=1 Tax=Leisingera caerulea TaxID=506591 RepID=UPI0021A4A9E6|nr:glycosyltransferase [Leisingera caerulea]UWQ61809.1 glycosyltransferase [Leisingera caerulea]